MQLYSWSDNPIQLLNWPRVTQKVQIFLPQRQVLLKLSTRPVIKMYNSSLNRLILKVKLSLESFVLLYLSKSFAFLQLFFISDCIEEEAYLGVFSLHLVLLGSSLGNYLFDFSFWEELLSSVEVELFEHMLHDIVDLVCHILNTPN